MTVQEALTNMSIFLGDQGMGPKTEQALFYLNRARRLVYPLDDWTHTIKYGCIPVCDCCIVLPNECAAIRAAWDGNRVVDIANEYFDSVPREYLVRHKGSCVSLFRTGVSLPAPFEPGCSLLAFQATDDDDAGVDVNLKYKGPTGRVISETISLQDNFQLTETEYPVREILALGKGRTISPVNICTTSGRLFYVMQPTFTCGRFEQYKIDGNMCYNKLLLKCKLRYKDYTIDDYDSLIDIESIDALEFAAKALYSKSQSDTKGYQENILLARTHLEVAKEDLETSSKGYEHIRRQSELPNRNGY